MIVSSDSIPYQEKSNLQNKVCIYHSEVSCQQYIWVMAYLLTWILSFICNHLHLQQVKSRLYQLKLLEKSPKYIILYLPLVTPLVALHPCHSFISLLWQHRPSDPIAENYKTVSIKEILTTFRRNFHAYFVLVYFSIIWTLPSEHRDNSPKADPLSYGFICHLLSTKFGRQKEKKKQLKNALNQQAKPGILKSEVRIGSTVFGLIFWGHISL